MDSPFLRRLSEKVIICDGAMGTSIQALALTSADFGGLEGCNENLNLVRPDLIKKIHESFLEAGADVIETNTFGASALVLAEYGLGSRALEISKKAAEIARAAVAGFSTAQWPRFVSGSIGPGTKLVTLGHVKFDELYASYYPVVLGLLQGGADLLQIETCQDILQAKCVVIAARDAMKEAGREVPICLTMTVETTGTMLLGTEVQAALAVFESLDVSMVGLNCATGPDLMQENVRLLCSLSSKPVAVLPNAGLPRNVNGKAVYDLTPENLARFAGRFVKDFGVAMTGGCCGTTPVHIRALYEAVGNIKPAGPKATFAPQLTSTFSAVSIKQEGSSPLLIGERLNANGSKQFRDLLLAQNWEGIVEMARSEAEQGSHVLDVCTAFVGRNEKQDMEQVIFRLSQQVTAPLMIDSTQEDVIETALKLYGGRAVINSINLEDGEEKIGRICRLARRFGAMVVALCIDEQGMAKTASRKIEVATRIYQLATGKYGLAAESLLFDALTFTVASGDEESRNAALETIEAIQLIKKELPGVSTVLGVSNISFGLKPWPRQVLNSVFLEEAVRAGLDAAIVHARKILPVARIEPEVLKLARDILFNQRTEGYDPLFGFIEKLEGIKPPGEDDETAETGSVADRLKKRIIDGRKTGLESLLTEALREASPVRIINEVLLEGMKTVGELFGAGKMQLPFVLQSAETMKKAVSFLEPFMDKSSGPGKGSMVLATVRGDVHDIGKNLVDIILSNNGYKVINLGIKQPLENIITAVESNRPDVIGLSGLLVKSTLVMKENLEELAKRGINLPVICGGAALNRAYVEVDLRNAYRTGQVYYGVDAFTGLRLMDEICGHTAERKLTFDARIQKERFGEMRVERDARVAGKAREVVRSEIKVLDHVPKPPFWGVRYAGPGEINLSEVFTFINRRSLFANQWMYRRGKLSSHDYQKFLNDKIEPLFHVWCQRAVERSWILPSVAWGYFPCQSEGNALHVYDPADSDRELCRIEFPRQVSGGRLCLADFFLPRSTGRMDVAGFHVVTAGSKPSEICQDLFKNGSYTDYLHFYGLSVETAEALAEYWHRRIRRELSIEGDDGKTLDAIFRQTYRGERFSFGYPACPNLEDQRHIFSLLKPESIGVSLTTEFQLVPEQTTSAIVCHHPQAGYFSIV